MTGWCKGPFGHHKENEMAKVSSRINRISLQWPIHIINPVDKTKLLLPTDSTTVSLEIYPLFKCNYVLGIMIMFSPGVAVQPNTILGVRVSVFLIPQGQVCI